MQTVILFLFTAATISMATTTTSSNPLVPSLQTQVFLHLIAKLDSYPANYLWLLPPRLREELLLSLPVADVCALEQTRFVDGLDMDRVWVRITQQRVPSELLQFRTSPVARRVASFKEFYMELLALVILNRIATSSLGHRSHYHLALDLMFSVKSCLGIDDWRGFLTENPCWSRYFRPGFHISRDDVVIPVNHYITYYSRGVNDLYLIQLLVYRCYYHPVQMNVLATEFISSVIRQEKAFPDILESYQKLTGKAEALWFRVRNDELCWKKSVKALLFATSGMIADDKTRLRHLFLQAPNMRSLGYHVAAITPFFCADDTYKLLRNRPTAYSNTGELGLANCSTFRNSLRSPYCKLREFGLIAGEGYRQCSPYLYQAVGSIVLSQQQLEAVMLSGFHLTMQPHSSSLRKITWALLHHIRRPGFQVLHLSHLSVPFSMFQLLTDAFLAAMPTSRQLLHLYNLEIQDTNRPFYTMETVTQPLRMPDKCAAFKHLRISHMKLALPVFSWLFYEKRYFNFHTLEIHAVETEDGRSLLATVARHPHLTIQHLYLSGLMFLRSPATAEHLHLLLSKKKLKVLAVCGCNLGPTGVLQDLTYALMKQGPWSNPSLEVLSLLSNKIGLDSDASVEEFFEALFALPHLSRLSVDIRDNELKPHHFSMMVRAWRRHSRNKRLNVLQCGNNHLPPNRLDVQRVAHWVFL